MDEPDPLAKLIVKRDQLDRDRILRSLEGRVAIDGGTGAVVILDGFDRLPTRERVVLFLLALKASALLGFEHSGAASPTQLARAAGMAEGTVRRLVSELRTERFIGRRPDGTYDIPDGLVSRACQFFSGDN